MRYLYPCIEVINTTFPFYKMKETYPAHHLVLLTEHRCWTYCWKNEELGRDYGRHCFTDVYHGVITGTSQANIKPQPWDDWIVYAGKPRWKSILFRMYWWKYSEPLSKLLSELLLPWIQATPKLLRLLWIPDTCWWNDLCRTAPVHLCVFYLRSQLFNEVC